ncbi:MAG TPA: response regulator, partial [Leptospiraceae bacterium]|nr:response regulator [Leptospiraceae bacterium]
MEPKQKDKYRTYRILLLEDDANSAEIVTRSLEKYNIHIDHVANARLAVSKLKNKYDLIISDVMMPIMDGFTFIEKHREEIQNTPIIILTALQEKEDILKAAALRITHYLVKPFEQAKLVNKVIEAMGIDPSFLILKKDYPFSISHDVIDESSIKLIIKGFATPSQFRTALPNYIMQLKTYSNNIKDFTIFVTGDFNYTSSAIELLDGMIQELIDSFSTRENHILLKGDFFQKVAPEDI